VPKSLTLKSDPPDDPATDADRPARGSVRIRQVPPPPPKTTGRRPPIPKIATDENLPTGWRGWWSQAGRRGSSSCAVSFMFHLSLLLALGLMLCESPPEGPSIGLVAYPAEDTLLDRAGREIADEFPVKTVRSDAVAVILPTQINVPNPNDLLEGTADPSNVRPVPSGTLPVRSADWMLSSDAPVLGSLDGRTAKARSELVGSGGGNGKSETAVARGLRWLMAHQREDGSWHFNHVEDGSACDCGDPGTEASTTAATAIALLPFLGAGHTHLEGEYRDVVRRGLYYLMKRTLKTPQGNDLQDGTMYAQGLATIVFCEAYAMTHDPALKDFAQGAIDFIVYAQDTRRGGWRYTPGEPGDTTVTGWQLMALKSGQMARLNVPVRTIYLAQRFLSSVQSERGALYGYMSVAPRQATTAIGLLCRMYTGWQREHEPLARGVTYLSEWEPSKDSMYYNYYATQVLHHWGGPEWKQWNVQMRDHLIATQANGGHQAGSWYFSGGRGDVGGRLYNTAMAVMTLEVYYRYMPLYDRPAVEEGF